MRELIRIEHLTIGYRNHMILENINTEVCSGELTCLVGRNGVGKSTLLRTVVGFQQPLAGSVLIDGVSIEQLSQRERAKLISVVLTEKPDVQNMTVREIVGLGRSPYTGFFGTLSDMDEAVVAEAIERVGMKALAERKIQTLSDGERQKMMIAKALAQQTPIIILDEPTAFLDYPSKVQMMQMLRQLAKEMDKTVVLSTHDIELAAKIATRFLLLSEKGLQNVQASELLTSFSLSSWRE